MAITRPHFLAPPRCPAPLCPYKSVYGGGRGWPGAPAGCHPFLPLACFTELMLRACVAFVRPAALPPARSLPKNIWLVSSKQSTLVGMWGSDSDRQNQQRHNSSGTGSGSGRNGPGCACGENSAVEVETMVTAVESETVGDSDNAFIPFGIYSN